MNIKELLDKQKELDKLIHERAGIRKYPLDKVKLALLTELGELANEVQSFKYWKQHKNINREKVLEEFADCLHFALSIENELKQLGETDLTMNVGSLIKADNNADTDFDFIYVYRKVIVSDCILVEVMLLGMAIGINGQEMEEAYLKKYQENIKRQQEGY